MKNFIFGVFLAISAVAFSDTHTTGGSTATTAAITSGTIDNTTIGATTPSTGVFSSITSNLGSPGAVTAPTNSNGIVIKNSAATGLSILTPDANAGRITFGTPSNNINVILYGEYNAGNPDFYVYINGAARMIVNATGINTTAIGASTPSTGAFTSLASSAHASVSTGATPTIASGACGTGSNGTISGTDQSGKITIGASATTACAVTFGSSTWSNGPTACTFSPATAASAAVPVLGYISALSASGFTLTGSALANTSFYYTCF